ncbi:hypothetical protein J437_LFUL012265, partial [Ladona fulva]
MEIKSVNQTSRKKFINSSPPAEGPSEASSFAIFLLIRSELLGWPGPYGSSDGQRRFCHLLHWSSLLNFPEMRWDGGAEGISVALATRLSPVQRLFSRANGTQLPLSGHRLKPRLFRDVEAKLTKHKERQKGHFYWVSWGLQMDSNHSTNSIKPTKAQIFLFRIYGWVPEYYNDPADLPEKIPIGLKRHINGTANSNPKT